MKRTSYLGMIAGLCGLLFAEQSPTIAAANTPTIVLEVASNGSLMLGDGRTLILRDILFPSALEQAVTEHAEALELLRRCTVGQDAQLLRAEADRYGALRGDLRLTAPRPDCAGDLQSLLLQRGLAIVFAAPDRSGPEVRALLAQEDTARETEKGLWRTPRLKDPAQISTIGESLVIIEGLVQSAAEVRGIGYINFGADWRQDTTVRLPPEVLKPVRKMLGALDVLAGRMVRVRGWLRWSNGPMIDLDQPAHLEILP